MSIRPEINNLMENISKEEEARVYLAIAELLLQQKLFFWMKLHIVEAHEYQYWDLFVDGVEVNTTRLAEEAIYESGLVPEELQEAAIEDETHPAWSAAVDASDWWEQDK